VRSCIGLVLIASTLCLSGCLSANSRQGNGIPPNSAVPKTFQPPPPDSPEAMGQSPGTVSRAGVLAGKVLDSQSQLRPHAIIELVDLEAGRNAPPLPSYRANKDGYFDITGLKAGNSYRLIARVRDGNRLLIGTKRVVPPDVRVAIFLSDEVIPEEKSPETSNLSSPPSVPGRPSEGTTIPLPTGSDSQPSAGLPPVVNTTNPALIGKTTLPSQNGFSLEQPRADVNIPSPGREYKPEKPLVPLIPPPPGQNNTDLPPIPGLPPDRQEIAPATPAPASGSEPPSGISAVGLGLPVPLNTPVVPSCRRIGNRVETFTLYGADGKVFDLQQHRQGKLVLLDFWSTSCIHCIHSIPHLNQLQSRYGPLGLEVIGVCYEPGSLSEKQSRLQQFCERRGIRFQYRQVFGGGGKDRCPVSHQLQVRAFPTFFLLDESGQILWQAAGLDEWNSRYLETLLAKHLATSPSIVRKR